MKVVEHYITNTNNYTSGRPGLDGPLFYVIHTYNGKGSFLGNQDGQGWFQTNNLGLSSSNCVLLDGTIERVVRREDTPHANGNWWANVRSITYELQDNGNPGDSERTSEQYEAVSEDIANDAYAQGYPMLNEANIQPHRNFASTGCPGGVDMGRIIRRANEILQQLRNPQPIIDNLYRVRKSGKQIGAFAEESNAFDLFVNEHADQVLQNGRDLTINFQEMANIKDQQYDELNQKYTSLNKLYVDTQTRYEEEIKGLNNIIKSYESSIFYKLFNFLQNNHERINSIISAIVQKVHK